jgi:hypothetical protein
VEDVTSENNSIHRTLSSNQTYFTQQSEQVIVVSWSAGTRFLIGKMDVAYTKDVNHN